MPRARTRYLAGMQSSIARGLAWAAALAAALVVARAGLVRLGHDQPTPVIVCDVPVELVTARGARLACATDSELRACTDLRAGDRVSGACQVERGDMAAAARLVSGVPIELNRATAADLQLLDGIGPKLADAIVVERGRAPFETVDDLVRVRGIGPKKLDAIRAFVTVVAN